MTTTLAFLLNSASPRIDQLADYAAGVLAIQREGIPQILHIHPADYTLLPAAVHNAETL